jgi:hypothetical protein
VTELRRPGLDLEDCCFGSCSLTLADFTNAIRHEPHTRQLLRWATRVGAVSLPLGVWLMTTPSFGVGLGAFVLGVGCFAAHNAPEQAAARWFAKTPREARSVRYTLSAAGLIVVSDAAHQSYAWRSLEGFHEAPEVFLVWVSSRSFLIVPKRAFAPAELPRIAARFAGEVGAPPALPPFWSWLALAVLLVLLSLVLWNHLAPR